MNTRLKLAVYGAGVLATFGSAFAVGATTDQIGLANAEPPAEHSGAMDMGDGLPGLASSVSGFSLAPATDQLTVGSQPYEFVIRNEAGTTVTDFDVEHTKRMHLIVVRRDFAGFQHLHPVMRPDGTWSTELDLADGGAYRVFADFVIEGDKHTAGTDLFVPGQFDPIALPEPATSADAGDGYEVELDGDVIAGVESELEFTIRHNGKVVRDIPNYLGAKGHLVALRDGDLAYLHVHADEERLSFEADFPTAGQYRLFLQFQHGGAVRTAAFTIDAKEA